VPVTEANLNDSITQHMRTDFSSVLSTLTVGEALASIREHPPGGRIVYFYVVDGESRLQGVVPTRRLLLSALETPIPEIMVPRVASLPMEATVLDACEVFSTQRLLALPIVGNDRKLLGVVDVDLYTDELMDIERSERNEALFQLIGVHLTQAQQGLPLVAFSKRFPWLLCNTGGGILAALLSGLFQAELERVVALALFIPVVLALAESVSIQSVSLALQVLHGRQITFNEILRKVTTEGATGALLGIASGILVALVALVWLGLPRVAACLGLGIAGGVTCAAVIGVALPNLFRLIDRDPQVAAGPIALAVSDMVTLLFYFNLARWLL
jgi:magnesium transporter